MADINVEEVLKQLTLAEKVDLLAGMLQNAAPTCRPLELCLMRSTYRNRLLAHKGPAQVWRAFAPSNGRA